MSPVATGTPDSIDRVSNGTAVAPNLTDPNAGDWRVGLLTALGVPANQTTLDALGFWHQSEGTSSSTYNWLAITDPNNAWPHAGVIADNGGNPVYAFPDQATGIAATASFLQHGYQPVIDRLKIAGNPQPGTDPTILLANVWESINKSGWCKGCQGGHYPAALFSQLGGTLPTDPGPTAGETGSSSSSSSGGDENVAHDPNCLLPLHISMPGSVPNVDVCLFKKSWGWAIVGGLSLAAGAGVMVLGVLLLTGRSSTARALVAGAAPSSFANRAQQAEEDAEGLALQREYERDARQALREKTAAAAKASRPSVDTGYRPRRGTKVVKRGKSTLIVKDDTPVTQEDPF